MLFSERVGRFTLGDGAEPGAVSPAAPGSGDRLVYTEYGTGSAWVILLHGQLMPRRMQQPLARVLAGAGFHVITLDLLGHGASDRPADPHAYSMTAFAGQVVALMDHLGIDQALVGGVSLGANVSLEVADIAPERVRGLLLEMPVLENSLDAALVSFGPLMFAARYLPWTVQAARLLSRPIPRGLVPFWAGVALDTVDQQPAAMSAVMHGLLFGRIAPPSHRRAQIQAPTLVVGHPWDPIHLAADAATVAREIPGAELVRATSIAEWRLRPERLDAAAVTFAQQCWGAPRRRRRSRA